MKRLDISVIAACIIAVVAIAMWTVTQHDAYVANMATIASDAESVATETEEAREAADMVADVDAEGTLHSAEAAGQAVASLQNEYMDPSIDAFSDAGKAKLREIANSMAEYRGNKEFQQAPWFYNSTEEVEWSFESGYDFSGDNLLCVWTCYPVGKDVDKRLVAYTFATYNSSTGKFSDSEIYITKFGASFLRTSDTEPAPEQKETYGDMTDEGVIAGDVYKEGE